MIRTLKERVFQTIAYELSGTLLLIPLYSLYFDAGVPESLSVLVVLSLVWMLWTGIHNYAFDWVEWRMQRRLASDRPASLRMIHATSLEVSCIFVSVPMIILMTDVGIIEAVMIDIVLTLVYILYGFIFHYIYDYLRPLRTGFLDVDRNIQARRTALPAGE